MSIKTTIAFIGTYAEASQSGLYACNYDAETGSLELLDQAGDLKNPTFLDVDVQHSRLYALAEESDSNNQKCGVAAAFHFHPSSGKLSLINKEVAVPAPICHITLDNAKQCLMVSSYHGGMIGMSPLSDDGRVEAASDIRRHEGSSVLPVQNQARAHSIFVDRFNRFAGVCDLGLDRIFLYRLDLDAYKFIPHAEVNMAPGSGPRHFVFHPSMPYGYVINELNATITAFTYDEDQGRLDEIQTVSTLPDDYKGLNACADIHISPDGKFLYGSNRGHDSIAVYSIDPLTGLLHLVEIVSVLGEHPRNFAISPDGRFVLVANRDTDNIVTFNRNSANGKLTPTGKQFHVSKPVCIKFAVSSGDGSPLAPNNFE